MSETKQFFGRCIICRKENVLLSDEHIIPDALGGVSAPRIFARRLDEHGSAMLALNPTGSTQDELGSAQYRGAKFTKAHQPVKLVYTEEYENEHEARMREQQLHGWSRAKKEALIRGDIETLKQLSKKKDLS